jgi:hypothetical protein
MAYFTCWEWITKEIAAEWREPKTSGAQLLDCLVA